MRGTRLFFLKLQWLAGLLMLLGGVGPARSATCSTIVTNGPATNRVNLVFFSEGYTSNQLGQFLVDVTNATGVFFSVEPYAEYSNSFNVFAIATSSAHSGSTHLIATNFTVGYTYFNSTYDGDVDRLITIPPNASDAINRDGQGKITALLQQFFPAMNTDMPVLMVNDPVGGGSDNLNTSAGNVIATTAIFSVGEMIFIVHESGHSLGGLGDEYTTPYPGFPSVEQPNTTTNTNALTLKWRDWVPTNTPIPTPPTVTYQDTVGLFQGAHYNTTGWYRPQLNCCMQSLGGVGFCSVCQEALVTAIYAKARPMDLHAPVADSLTVTSATQQLTFSLDLLQPATHSLGVQWRTNGVTVTGATNPVFNLWPVQLGNGTKTVEADVWDPTAMVRTNSPNLKQTNVWTLSLTLPALPAMPLMPLTNGQRVSNSVLTVVGTAATDGYLAAVDYQFNHAGWTPTGGTTNWSVTLNLLPGTNVFQVFAVDVNGVRSPTNTVLIDCVVTNPVTVQTVGLGTLSPNYSNAWLEIGRNYTMTATPGSGFAFTNWTVSTNGPGGVTTNQTTVQFMMASNLTLVAGFVDGQKPAVSLTNFLGGQRVSNLLFTVRGTASDNWRVVGVWCQINHSVWLPAGTTNAFTNWFAANLSLIAGTNLISAYASDPAGDYSSTNTLALVATNVLAPTNAAAPVVRLTDPQMTPGGLQFNLQISGEDLGLIQVSTDLAHWDTVTNFAGANTNLLFCDPATHPPQRFYRVGP